MRILQAGVKNVSTLKVRNVITRQEWAIIRAEERDGSVWSWQVFVNSFNEDSPGLVPEHALGTVFY